MNKEEFKKCMDYLEQHRDEIVKINEEAKIREEKEFEELLKQIEGTDKETLEGLAQEKSKSEVIKEKPEVSFGDNLVLYKLKDMDISLTFDDIGFKLFNTEFLKSEYDQEMIIYKSGKTKYLAKRCVEGKINDFFHRWLMIKEIHKFALDNSISNKFDIVVHHKNGNSLDNRKSNLQVMTKNEHLKIHHRVC